MNVLKNSILGEVYPENYTCLYCGKEINNEKYDLCQDCKLKLPYLSGTRCKRCGQEILINNNYCDNCKENGPWYFDLAMCNLKYEGIATNFVRRIKYDGNKYLAKAMAELMIEEYLSHKNLNDIDFVAYVPMTPKKQKIRGYNQAYEVAKHISEKLNRPISNVLIRTKENISQAELSGQARRQNVIDSFSTDGTNLRGKTILLIDDVYTTGSTINECSKALKNKAHAKCIYVLTFAKAQ